MPSPKAADGRRPGPRIRSFRSRLLLVTALAVSVPALLACVILGYQLDRQTRQLFANELSAELDRLALALQDRRRALIDGLKRAAADNTLQLTLDLDMGAQLAQYVEAQRQVLQIAFLAVYDRAGQRATLSSDAAVPGAPWHLSKDPALQPCAIAVEGEPQLIVCNGAALLVSMVPVLRSGGSGLGDGSLAPASERLGHLAGGAPLAEAELAASLQQRRIAIPLIWADDSLVLPSLAPSNVQRPPAADGVVREIDFGGTHYLGSFREMRIGARRLTYGVVTPLAPLQQTLFNSVLAVAAVGTLLVGLSLVAVRLIANRLLRPIQQLGAGAALIGHGDLRQRLTIRTGDELERLGEQFNAMAERLQESYANLERKVEHRTQELEAANLAKARFLAAASHDLRQPLHALNLLVEQLRAEADPSERSRVLDRIGAAVAAMNELFDALLDMSRLDAGVLVPDLSVFPVQRLFERVETTFAGAAHEKGLKLRLIASEAWAFSDFVLLERILLNLVSNAVRYTRSGGVLIGCRRRGNRLALEVWDTGPGIAPEQRSEVFREFLQLEDSVRQSTGGLGLGLAIVDRLCRLLDHPLELASVLGRGSRFRILVPRAEQQAAAAIDEAVIALPDPLHGKAVIVIDDDELVRVSMRGVLRTWGCEVMAAASEAEAEAAIALHARAPELIICDFRLPGAASGIDVVASLRARYGLAIPAFLISGDTSPERLQQASESGLMLLHKPVQPLALRAVLMRMLAMPASPAEPAAAA